MKNKSFNKSGCEVLNEIFFIYMAKLFASLFISHSKDLLTVLF